MPLICCRRNKSLRSRCAGRDIGENFVKIASGVATSGILAANPPHSIEARAQISPGLRIQEGRANPCPFLEQNFGEINFAGESGTYLFSLRVPRWLLAPERWWLSARRTRTRLPAIREPRKWANRNSERTARFVTGWARVAEDEGRISRGHRSVTAIPTRTCFERSTKEFPAQPCRRTARRSRAWA